MLPLLNEIDKRDVKEINEDYNTDDHNSEETEINPEIVDSSDIQNPSDSIKQPPAISEVSPQKTPPKENLSVDLPAINSLSGPEMPKHEVPARRNPLMNNPKKDTNLEESSTELLNSQETLHSSALKMRPKRYICEICINRGFTTKFSLRRHNNKFHSSNRNTKKDNIDPDTLSTSEPMPETIVKNQKRLREESVENDEIQNFQEAKKLKTRGLKRWLDSDSTQYEHLPRKSARIQSFKRKSQFSEKPPKRVAIQKGQGLSNWVCF